MALVDAKRTSKPRTASIVVVHPGVQHSRELARALYEEGLLSRFVTSIGGGICDARWLPAYVRGRLAARRTVGLPDDRVITIPWIEILPWLLRPVLGVRARDRVLHAGLDLFDRLAARRALSVGARIVVGVENSCLHLFRAAKAAGALCVLDAASVHHCAQPRSDSGTDSARMERIDRRKDAELRLADRIVVLSSYARDTYAAAGVPAAKLAVMPPGIWRDSSARRRAAGPGAGNGIRFLYVGNVKRAKGIDLLLAAFERLAVEGIGLLIAGATQECDVLTRPPAGVAYLGRLNRDAVYDAYARADVLVLPSHADGFGFAAAEAMASGLPAIVSSAVGAKDYVEHGVSGWIFESGSLDQLEHAMRDACARRAELAAMGERARTAVAGLTWEAYGARIRALYRGFLECGDSIPSSDRGMPVKDGERRAG